VAAPDEITEEERERRHAMALRIGTAPGAPSFSMGPGRRPYTPSLHIANAPEHVKRATAARIMNTP
jgi:hypothetical protein